MDWARSCQGPQLPGPAVDWAGSGLGRQWTGPSVVWAVSGLGPQWTGHRLPVTRVSPQSPRPLDCG